MPLVENCILQMFYVVCAPVAAVPAAAYVELWVASFPPQVKDNTIHTQSRAFFLIDKASPMK